ncbi:nuclear transport factor 2 family protein [Nocardia otitidiscaviarum]|uniref:nuclear transport factor 2 family protein n=1 Tax=Nocardia otitidiscaviarum TaxID=1823 RepID=UPI0004A7227F|nr:nuclear transport factor 2 family protein [Nocardia otitidiscaviarum]MBF6133697.1 nuclear transport factor 2 family protein [Nocardia otitidiscaviarum]MBF6235659.1 nuclear transport factor 2 family protein [Nocardia otitidiscaviarum]MBF6487725.1 nuclear transport factor 2 family protein [Nocardia otitidiscaviarum]
MTDKELLNELLAVERRGWDALCTSTGADFYGSLMTEDGVMVLANGMVLDRDGVIDSLKNAPPWRTFELESPRLVDAGDSTILVYTGIAYREGAEPAFRGVMTSVYVRGDGDWRLACYQQTPIPD